MKSIAMVATMLVALAGTAVADFEGTFDANVAGEAHQLYIYIGDDGSATLLLDGAPILPSDIPSVPGAPEVPGVPGAPEVPGIPEVPELPGGVPEVPGTPTVPELPGVPGLPGIPTLP